MERTLMLIKPDGVQRRLVGRILSRLEDKGLKLAGLKLMTIDTARAKRLYEPHVGKKFYDGLVRFMTSGPVIALVVEGAKVIAICRKLMGATFGPNAEPGTIRGDFGSSMSYNLVHGSDSPESAAREIPIFFHDQELLAHEHADTSWVYDRGEDLK